MVYFCSQIDVWYTEQSLLRESPSTCRQEQAYTRLVFKATGQAEARRVDLFVGKTQVLVEHLIKILAAVVPGQIFQKLVGQQCQGSGRVEGEERFLQKSKW